MDALVKIMLVDDEQFVLERIQKTVSWEQMGMELTGCCTNAMEALDHMINEMPDILITDIKMPVVGGLELIAKTKQMNPSIECVVLSGYAEFDLARDAMQQGVKHYLLKPFSKAEFEAVLEKTRSQILDRRQEQILKLEKRTEIVEKIAWELQLLKENYERVDAWKIQTLMKAYPDLSMLRSAVIYLLVKSPEINRAPAEYISGLFAAGQDIYVTAAKALNELFCEEVNESLLVRKIKEYTKNHYGDESLNLQLIADRVVHLGVKYTGRCFLKETGCKYSEYLLRIRMEKAKEMLKSQDGYRVEHIAETIGLGHDVPYFYQLFKKYTGVTPKEYRSDLF
ncbi:MAG: response regulator [Lachnospiraceae bacterium]|nr:response regulator [Lachnospiraceae bacterium]